MRYAKHNKGSPQMIPGPCMDYSLEESMLAV